ncbi:MAG: hypothetical protein IANPNBLG_04788 [Bryobacteraceae bacterium]|nr:hypothetical protein [Bryobacteraceae bacterium]
MFADAGEAAGEEKGKKLIEIPFIAGFANEAADGVDFGGAGGTAIDLFVADITAGKANAGGAFSGGAKVDEEGAAAVERTKVADAVAKAGEEDGKFGAGYGLPVALELGWGEKANMETAHIGGVWGEIQGEGRMGLVGEKCPVFEEEEGGGIIGRQLLDGQKTGAATARADAFLDDANEGEDEVGEQRIAGIEQVEAEGEFLARVETAAAEVSGAQDKGSGHVAVAAG